MTALAITGTYVRMKTLADGTVRVELDLDCGLADAAGIFSGPGSPVAIARMTQEAAQQGLQQAATAQYGEQAKYLRLSGFFRAPDVWRAIGPDKDFLEWLKHQGCGFGTDCQGDIVPAHVRRIANGAGTAVKPEYSAISLCDYHHKLQHQHGETHLAPKEWWDKMRIEQIEQWGWETLKDYLGYEHWNQVPPLELLAWAEDYRVDQYLPREYRDAQ